MIARLALAAALLLAVPATASAGSAGFTNPALIYLPNEGKANPYPSQINVHGVTGQVTEVSLSLNGLNHPRPSDVDILLQAPSGKTSIVMSDACGNAPLNKLAFIFERTAPRMSGFCPGLIYAPTNDFGETDWWPEAARGLWTANLDHFLASNPNGVWKLFVIDGRPGPSPLGGVIANGWSLQLTTETADVTVPAVTGRYDGQADRYPVSRAVTGLDGVIEDVDVSLDGVYHEVPADLELLLTGPGGQTVSLMDDACRFEPIRGYRWRWDDEAPAAMPTGTACAADTAYRPADHAPDDRLPDPAPSGPYGAALSVLDGTDPNGEWRLYAHDQQRNDHTTGERRADGFFAKPFALHITTRPRAVVTLAPELTVAEGRPGELELTRTGADGLGAGSVELTATAGSAVPGDYAPEPIAVPFAAGQRSARIAVAVLPDDEREGSETFTLAISGAEGDARPGDVGAGDDHDRRRPGSGRRCHPAAARRRRHPGRRRYGASRAHPALAHPGEVHRQAPDRDDDRLHAVRAGPARAAHRARGRRPPQGRCLPPRDAKQPEPSGLPALRPVRDAAGLRHRRHQPPPVRRPRPGPRPGGGSLPDRGDSDRRRRQRLASRRPHLHRPLNPT